MASPFSIAANEGSAHTHGRVYDADDVSLDPVERVHRMVGSADVFVFMKGSPAMPRCGFSANTVAILERLGVPYSTFDVLGDESIRAAAKEVAMWPTFPQVWVRGSLAGGNDIITEMYASGELTNLLHGVSE